MPTNREKLEAAGIVDKHAHFNKSQEEAIASLTAAEVDALISAKQKLTRPFTPEKGHEAQVGIIEHHH